MLLTYGHAPAGDRPRVPAPQHPDRVHTREFPFGLATVFYPEASEEACRPPCSSTSIRCPWSRGREGRGGVEDRTSTIGRTSRSSLLSVVLNRWFNTALAGRCERQPGLPDLELPLEALVAAVPCSRRRRSCARCSSARVRLDAVGHPLDETLPVLGTSRLFTVTLRATRRISEL